MFPGLTNHGFGDLVEAVESQIIVKYSPMVLYLVTN